MLAVILVSDFGSIEFLSCNEECSFICSVCWLPSAVAGWTLCILFSRILCHQQEVQFDCSVGWLPSIVTKWTLYILFSRIQCPQQEVHCSVGWLPSVVTEWILCYFIQQNSWPSKRSAATCARGFKPLRPRWKCKSALCLVFPHVQNGPFLWIFTRVVIEITEIRSEAGVWIDMDSFLMS